MDKFKTENARFIGRTPHHLKEEHLVSYFLYAYEFSWNADAFDDVKDNLPVYFSSFLLEEKRKHPDLSVGRQWWALVLYALKTLAENKGLTYAIETIHLLLTKCNVISEEALEDYCNSINELFSEEMAQNLSLRPLEIRSLHSNAYESDPTLAYFLDKKDSFIQSFKKHLSQDDISPDYLERFLINDKETTNKYTTMWNIYFELFIGYSLSMQLLMEHANPAMMTRKRYVEENIHLFLTSSLVDAKKIRVLSHQLAKIIHPLYTH